MTQGNGKPTARSPKINVGSASVVVIFSVLCLTVFAVLSYITADSEQKLGGKSVNAMARYYNADFTASEIAQNIVSLVSGEMNADIAAEKINVAGFQAGVFSRIDQNMLYLSYGVPVDNRQEIRVVLLLSEGVVRPLTWRIYDNGTWQPDTDLPVWQGD